MLCKICKKIFKNIKSLGCHIGKAHHAQSYHYVFIKNNYNGICKFCKKDTSFININRGYKIFCDNSCKKEYYSIPENNSFYGKTHTKEVMLILNSIKRPCGKDHSNYGIRGEKSKLYGRKRPQSWKDKMLEIHKGKKLTQETKDKISKANKGRTRSFNSRLRQSILLRGRKGRILTEEAKNKISKTLSNSYVSGKIKFGNRYKHGEYVSSKSNEIIFYRSNYELIAIKIFEDDDNIISIEHEPEKIPIILDGKHRYTVPDFRIILKSGKIKIIEIKPMIFIKKNIYRAKDKIKQAVKYYISKGIKYEVWTEKRLGLYTK